MKRLITFTLLMRKKLVQQLQAKVTMDINMQALLDIALKKNFQALSLFIDIGTMMTISTPQMLMKLEQRLLDISESMAIIQKASHAMFYLRRCFDSLKIWNSLH